MKKNNQIYNFAKKLFIIQEACLVEAQEKRSKRLKKSFLT